jgi:hypothetical protein
MAVIVTAVIVMYLVVTLIFGSPSYLTRSRDSVVCIATHYRLDGPGIESRQWRDFFTRPDRPCGQPRLLYNGCWVFPMVKTAEVWR